MADNREFSKEAVEAFRRFTKKADFYAVCFKLGDKRDKAPHVEYKLFTGEGLWNLFRNEVTRTLFTESKGTLRWRVCDMLRGKWKAVNKREAFADAVATFRWKGTFEDVFPSDTNDRSRSQEEKVAAAMNAIFFKETTWKAVGHEKMSARTWNPDAISENGLTLEVKGDNSDLRISFEANAEKFGF